MRAIQEPKKIPFGRDDQGMLLGFQMTVKKMVHPRGGGVGRGPSVGRDIHPVFKELKSSCRDRNET